MNMNATELVFILDRSGSMGGLESDTIGGFNSMLAKQKALPGNATVTTVLFDNHIRLLHDRLPLTAVAPLTEKDYFVGGSTALLDALGMAIEKLVNVQRHLPEELQAGHVQFVIITDGMENASREFTLPRIRQMITHEQEKYGWDFLFLGANIDAIATAGGLGIHADRAVTATNDTHGIQQQYEAISYAVTEARCGCAPTATWKQSIEKRHPKKR